MVMHLPETGKKLKLPRMALSTLKNGIAFGHAGDTAVQRSILEQLLALAIDDEPGKVIDLDYGY